jgi:hypothetical protein
MPFATPPRPRCAFRVAAIGHRWDRLAVRDENTIRNQFRSILGAIAATVDEVAAAPEAGFAPAQAPLTLFSALAEGTDRLAAEAVLQTADRWCLHALAPFDLLHYERDFQTSASAPRSVEHFRTLWHAAAARTVLDGVPGEFDAYAPLARALVDLCDILIVVWDGEHGRGPGGTAASVQQARRDDIAVIRIDAKTPAECWLENLERPDHGRAERLTRLDGRLRSLLAPPRPVRDAGEPAPIDLRADYFAERIPARPVPRVHDRVVALLQATTVDGRRIPFRDRLTRARQAGATPALDDPGLATRDAWTPRWSRIPASVRDQVLDRFADHHGWADRLATAYGAAFRQTFTWVFMLAWIAVLAAYLGAVRLDVSPVGISIVVLIEIGVLATINLLVHRGRHRRLHERWLDYRSLAERLRHLAVLWPLARSTPLVRVPLSPLAGDPRESWVGWMLRGVAREAGMIEGTLDHAHALACRDLLRDAELDPQRAFHRGTMSRAAQVQHLLAQFAERLFLAALVLAALHLVIGFVTHWSPGLGPATHAIELVLAGCGVAFPAIAASIHGFLGTGDFAGIAIRSASMEPQLAQADVRLGRLDPLNTTTVGELAVEVTALMERELSAWRNVAQTRELETP